MGVGDLIQSTAFGAQSLGFLDLSLLEFTPLGRGWEFGFIGFDVSFMVWGLEHLEAPVQLFCCSCTLTPPKFHLKLAKAKRLS